MHGCSNTSMKKITVNLHLAFKGAPIQELHSNSSDLISFTLCQYFLDVGLVHDAAALLFNAICTMQQKK